MKILPVNEVGDCRQGTLSNLSVKEITNILGFAPNCQDDPDKVKHSWGFSVDGVRCGVWDYRGSGKFKTFSTFGDHATLKKVFGANYSA
jgi:hypothetical protein